MEAALTRRLAQWDIAALTADYRRQDELLVVADFLPSSWLEALRAALPALAAQVHRNFIPNHKKGGSISRFVLDAAAPLFGEIYRSRVFVDFLTRLTGRDLIFCPERDAHTYALYYYTEPGDHIGYHYDTSYYKGARFTVLLGLVNDSNCLLEYQLRDGDAGRPTATRGVRLEPGTLVVFNGDKLYHRVTPLGAGERRICLTLEYLTNAEMHPVRRLVSDLKDSIAYFGFKQVFKRRSG